MEPHTPILRAQPLKQLGGAFAALKKGIDMSSGTSKWFHHRHPA
jgi:hypothetical protein